jgi:hypothetical protein
MIPMIFNIQLELEYMYGCSTGNPEIHASEAITKTIRTAMRKKTIPAAL